MEFVESIVLASTFDDAFLFDEFDDAFLFDEVDYFVHEEAACDEPEY